MTIQEVVDEKKRSFQNLVVGLGVNYARCINKTDINLEPISRLESVREILNYCYATMVGMKLIVPIEQLPAEVKDEYRAEARQHCAALTTPEKMRFIKAAYCMVSIIDIYP